MCRRIQGARWCETNAESVLIRKYKDLCNICNSLRLSCLSVLSVFAVVRLKSRHSTHSIGILKKKRGTYFFYVQWKHNAQRQNWTLLSSIALNQRRLKKSPNCFPRLFSQTVLLGRKVVNVIYAEMIQKEQHKNPLLSLDSYCFGINSLGPGKVRIPLSRWRNHQFGLTSIEPMK